MPDSMAGYSVGGFSLGISSLARSANVFSVGKRKRQRNAMTHAESQEREDERKALKSQVRERMAGKKNFGRKKERENKYRCRSPSLSVYIERPLVLLDFLWYFLSLSHRHQHLWLLFFSRKQLWLEWETGEKKFTQQKQRENPGRDTRTTQLPPMEPLKEEERIEKTSQLKSYKGISGMQGRERES